MTDPDTELADAFEEAAATADRVYEGRAGDDDALSADAEETLRDPVVRLADAVSEASLDELLRVAGFEDRPDEVTPVDLPTVIRDADADAIVELRTLLQLADLGESWSELSSEERTERVDRIAGESRAADDGGLALEEYIDRLGHILGDEESSGDESSDDEGSAAADAEEEASPADGSPADESSDGESASGVEGAVESVVDAAAEAASDGDSDAETEAEADTDGDAGEGSDAEDAEGGGSDDGGGAGDAVEAVVDAAAEAMVEGDDGEDASATDGTADDADADEDGDDELLELEDHVDRLRKLVGDDSAAETEAAGDANAAEADAAEADAEAAEADAGAAEADAVEEAEEDAEDGDGPTENRTKSTSGSRPRLSTVPSSRSDMGKSSRFSTARGKR